VVLVALVVVATEMELMEALLKTELLIAAAVVVLQTEELLVLEEAA
jgi:hypothetical protein